MSKDQHQLAATYLKDKIYVSTAYRSTVTICGEYWYYETIAFEWDRGTKQLGGILKTADSGSDPETAIISHFKIVKELMNCLIDSDNE